MGTLSLPWNFPILVQVGGYLPLLHRWNFPVVGRTGEIVTIAPPPREEVRQFATFGKKIHHVCAQFWFFLTLGSLGQNTSIRCFHAPRWLIRFLLLFEAVVEEWSNGTQNKRARAESSSECSYFYYFPSGEYWSVFVWGLHDGYKNWTDERSMSISQPIDGKIQR